MGDTIRIYVFYSNSNSNNSDPYLPIPVLDKIQGKINFNPKFVKKANNLITC